MKKVTIIFALLGVILMATGCPERQVAKKIRLEKKEALETRDVSKKRPLRAAIGGIITPKEGAVYYRDFLFYIEDKLGRPVEFVDKESYEEINNLLESGDLDFAFVCSGPYVTAHDAFGLQLLVAPEVNGETSYYSYIIVNSESPVTNFKELRGKTFAFTDPLSNTGKLVPTYMLSKMHETPASFFKEFIYSKKHDISIKMVASKLVDGAAVDSLIWEYMKRKRPETTVKTRIILKSPPYGIPPVVTSQSMDRATREKLKEIFLNAHNDKRGKEILSNMMIDRFVPQADRAYDSVREMISWTKKEGA